MLATPLVGDAPRRNAVLFHELVHAAQFRLRGVRAFAREYVRGWLSTSAGYAGIPLEIEAYALQGRYESDPTTPFDVESEVRTTASSIAAFERARTPPPPSLSLGHQIMALIVSLGVCFAAAGLGGLATSRSVTSWFQTLNRPSFQPPDWLFGPVWSVLYTLMGVSAWLVYRRTGTVRSTAMAIFAVQLALNTLWSVLFFGLRMPGLAAIEIVALLLAIVATIAAFARVSRPAAALLLPYVAWVAFATALNVAIWRLN